MFETFTSSSQFVSFLVYIIIPRVVSHSMFTTIYMMSSCLCVHVYTKKRALQPTHSFLNTRDTSLVLPLITSLTKMVLLDN